jgi:hypothetical protein
MEVNTICSFCAALNHHSFFESNFEVMKDHGFEKKDSRTNQKEEIIHEVYENPTVSWN